MNWPRPRHGHALNPNIQENEPVVLLYLIFGLGQPGPPAAT